MKNEPVAHHHSYYIIEMLLLGLGFILLATIPAHIFFEALILIVILSMYIFLGLIHHQANHTLRKKIVLEYILVSLLVLSAFLFIHSARL